MCQVKGRQHSTTVTKPRPIPNLAAGQFKFPGLLFLAPEALLLSALAVDQPLRATQFRDCLRNLRNMRPHAAQPVRALERAGRSGRARVARGPRRGSTSCSFQPPAAAAESSPQCCQRSSAPLRDRPLPETPRRLSRASPSQVAARCRSLRSTSSSLEIRFSYDPATFKCPRFKVPSTLLPSLSPPDCD